MVNVSFDKDKNAEKAPKKPSEPVASSVPEQNDQVHFS